MEDVFAAVKPGNECQVDDYDRTASKDDDDDTIDDDGARAYYTSFANWLGYVCLRSPATFFNLL
jgi:hypothetical protein